MRRPSSTATKATARRGGGRRTTTAPRLPRRRPKMATTRPASCRWPRRHAPRRPSRRERPRLP
eukprot:3657084-Prymnesium_polylepis.1